METQITRLSRDTWVKLATAFIVHLVVVWQVVEGRFDGVEIKNAEQDGRLLSIERQVEETIKTQKSLRDGVNRIANSVSNIEGQLTQRGAAMR